MKERYTVTEDIDILAPLWLALQIEKHLATVLYRYRDGHAEVKGVRIRNEVAEIGDTILYDGKRLSVERR